MLIGLVLAFVGHKHLTVREITVEGGERIQAKTVQEGLPIQVGMPWLTVDTAAARQVLLRFPDVHEASVTRGLWGRVHVRITEREPQMVAQLGKKLWWMDTHGFFYREATAPVYGPVVVEPPTVETDRGRRLADLFYLVPLRAIMNAPGGLINHIQTIRLEGTTMMLSLRNGPDVLVSIYDVGRDLGRLRRLMKAFAGHRRLDLRFERVVVVDTARR